MSPDTTLTAIAAVKAVQHAYDMALVVLALVAALALLLMWGLRAAR